MTISTILAIVFGWLFVNNWLTIIFVKTAGDFFSSWMIIFGCLSCLSSLRFLSSCFTCSVNSRKSLRTGNFFEKGA